MRNSIRLAILLVIITATGTIGYMAIERWTAVDALYMTLITLTTVGFGEVQTLSATGRIFTMVLMLLGVGSVAYAFSVIGESILSANISGLTKKRRMMRTVQQLSQHFIVCGYGRVGENAAAVVHQSKQPLVVVDVSAETLPSLQASGIPYVAGDATDDNILIQAGIERAQGLLVCTGNDTDNLFIVLSARSLNSKLFIVSRSSNPQNEPKMRRAGANKVISPYQIGGQRMANIAIRPNVADFVDILTLNSGLELWLEDVTIHPSSPLVGRTIQASDIRRHTGVTLVLISRTPGQLITPRADTQLEAHDELIVLGTRDQLTKFATLAGKDGAE